MSNTDTTTANTILEQIGHKALTMMGTKARVAGTDGDSLILHVGKNSKRVQHITVTLDRSSDTYTVRFTNSNVRRAVMVKELALAEGIYADQLHAVIERETGFYLSL